MNKEKLAKQKYDIVYRQRYKEEKPWMSHYSVAKYRCNTKSLHKKFKYYAGKGIKFLLTIEEVKYLWFRDKAYEMDRPSIDRKDSNKDYVLDNCQFIELLKNVGKENKHKFRAIYQFDLNGNFIREWESIKEATINLKISKDTIGKCLNGKYKQGRGFIWRYKE